MLFCKNVVKIFKLIDILLVLMIFVISNDLKEGYYKAVLLNSIILFIAYVMRIREIKLYVKSKK